MIQLLHLLLVSLGFCNDHKPKHSLRRQPHYTILNLRNPVLVIIVAGLGMVLFALFVFMFMPGTESGIVYNGSYI